MPINHRKIRSTLTPHSAISEGAAIARAQAWRSRIKSKAQVKRRSKRLDYFQLKETDKTPKARIRDFDAWQFPQDFPDVELPATIPRWQFYMPIIPKSKKEKQEIETIKADNASMLADFIAKLGIAPQNVEKKIRKLSKEL